MIKQYLKNKREKIIDQYVKEIQEQQEHARFLNSIYEGLKSDDQEMRYLIINRVFSVVPRFEHHGDQSIISVGVSEEYIRNVVINADDRLSSARCELDIHKTCSLNDETCVHTGKCGDCYVAKYYELKEKCTNT